MDNPRHYKPHIGRRPVSCRFCRSRKLRCSREAPCSNCLERHLPCDLQTPKALPHDETKSELLERIARLEKLLTQQQNTVNAAAAHIPPLLPARPPTIGSVGSYLTTPELGKSADPEYGIQLDLNRRLEAGSISEKPSLLLTHRQSPSVAARSLDDDVAQLERLYVNKDTTLVKILSPRVVFRVCRMQDIINGSALEKFVHGDTKFICLPEHQEAKICLQKFTDDLEYIHHVFHVPSLPAIIDDLYLSLNENAQIKPGHVILLLGILVSSIHSWSHHDHKRGGMFSSRDEASAQIPLFLRYLEDVLDISHRNSVISIEGVQGLIIASFVLCNYEGFSRRSRSWYSICLLLARELGLHHIDRPGSHKAMTHLEAEIGRRVWWYIATSDWMIAARFVGIAQGVYSCHVRQMMTNKPLHINDEDIYDDHAELEKPMSQPTMMSYFLHRLKLTEICRRHLDLLPLIKADKSSSAYEIVLDIDSDIQHLQNELPPFFSMSPSEIMTKYHLSALRASHIHYNGYMIRQLIHAQRCSMHIPYLSRSYNDNTYAPSRVICLAAARAVVATETALEDSAALETVGASSELLPAARYKFLGLLMVVFMCSVILLVDQCQRKRSERTAELQAAITLLERARIETPTVARFLTQLMDVLQRHKLPSAAPLQQSSSLPIFRAASVKPASRRESSCLQLFPGDDGVPTPPVSYSGAASRTPHSINLDPPLSTGGDLIGAESKEMDITTFFDEFADTMQSGGMGFDAGDFGGMDWQEMFLELDGHMG